MKRFPIHNYLITTASFMLTTIYGIAQDIHLVQVQSEKIWYNPALKTDKDVMVHAGIRSVNYPGIMNYASKALTVELPITRGEADEQNNRNFANLAIGIDADNSKIRPVNVSTAMMALSWALPLNYDNTYIEAGFQAAYTFSRIPDNDYLEFPDHFDDHGPVGWAILIDPARTGFTYQYFTVGAGASVFHMGLQRQWYVGGSIRHFNQPLTDKYNVASYRLPKNYGIQGGYSTGLSNNDVVGAYANFTWQGNSFENVIGGRYTHHISDSTIRAFTFGVGYRIGQSVIPEIEFNIWSYRLGFFYEFNIPADVRFNYHRKSFEVSIKAVW